MLEQFKDRSALTYFMLFIVNPILILCFQNCSVVRLSDLKAKIATVKIGTAKIAPVANSGINSPRK